MPTGVSPIRGIHGYQARLRMDIHEKSQMVHGLGCIAWFTFLANQMPSTVFRKMGEIILGSVSNSYVSNSYQYNEVE